MDIHSARQKLKTGTIYDLPLRVTFYAPCIQRVG